MNRIHRSAKVLPVLGLGAALCLLAAGSAQAGTKNCQYHLNVENQADASIDVKSIQWRKKDVGTWKSWHYVQKSSETIGDGDKEEYKNVQETVACYRYKWKLQWRCSAESDWNDYQIPADDPDNDRVSNWFLLVTGCDGGDVSRSEDGDFF
jgi:hypothetical protein